MAHRLSPEAEAELDGIWYYVATGSSSVQVADHLIYTLTKRFYLLALNPHLGRRRDEDLRPGMRSFAWVTTSFFTVSNRKTCWSCTWSGAAGTSTDSGR